MTPRIEYIGGNEALKEYYNSSVSHASPGELWRSQPHLRTVVTFLARNVAQLGLHLFERVGETDRRRDRSSIAAQVLAAPDGSMTTYDLVYALIGDMLLYDTAYWFVGPSMDRPSGMLVRRIPPSWVSQESADPFAVKSWRVTPAGERSAVVPASQMLAFTGYSPSSPIKGSPTIEALRGTIEEQLASSEYRRQVWKNGGRVSSVIERPKDAPRWSNEARTAFREDWYSKFTGQGPRAGGTPILEDGMTLTRVDFSAQEQQFVEAAKLSLVTVAAAFHVNPTMIGQNDGANYSNVREFRKMLYGDTLGPLLAQVEARLNAFLLPMLGMDPARFYVEFNIAEKLQGNFEEQSAAMQTATGAPWMTRNEARARVNLPQIAGGDGLVVPLNVLAGGQASPTDSAPKAPRPKEVPAARAVKGRAVEWEQVYAEELTNFRARQSRVVLSRLGAKADWWDEDRWNAELGDLLYQLGVQSSEAAAKDALEAMGVDPDSYDLGVTLAYLRARADISARAINDKAKEQVQQALTDGESPAGVFEAGIAALAVALVTAMSGFGTAEAGKQSGATAKTWITGRNPRPEHAALDGVTVPIGDKFPNGLMWPGDAASSDADELAGCNCEITFSYGGDQ